MTSGKIISPEKKALAAVMADAGHTHTTIGETLGICRTSVSHALKAYRNGELEAAKHLDLSAIRNTMTQALLEKVEPIIAGITQDKIDEGKVHQLALAAKLLSDSGRNWAQIGREEARVQINVANLTTSIED